MLLTNNTTCKYNNGQALYKIPPAPAIFACIYAAATAAAVED